MKVFFDTNVYVAEALVGGAAEVMLSATADASWRIFVSHYVLCGCPYRGENPWIRIRALSRFVMCALSRQAAKQALALATVPISHVNSNFASP
ncbi:MAG: hypothetical protein NTY19_36325 [Planctomycetota bacterium]|nr:hypothetical protein [Planctomycetota bacterium]